MKLETKRLFDKSSNIYTPASMLASIDNKVIVECLIKLYGCKSFYTKTIQVFDDDISNLNEFDIVKISIKVDDTQVIINFDKVTSLTELVKSNCITSRLNEAIAALIVKDIDTVSINDWFRKDNWMFIIGSEKEVPKSPILLRIPNKEELDYLRKEYSRLKDEARKVVIPLPFYLRDNAKDVVTTENAGN